MSTFNVLASKKGTFGGDNPIWLGHPRALPKGGVLASGWTTEGRKISAGSPVEFKDGTVTPFVAWKVVSIDTTNHALTIKVSEQYADVLPKANDFLTPVGTTFATTGAAGKVSSIAADTTEGQYVVTMTDAKLDGVTANSYISYSAATAVASSGASLACQPNGYVYNDIYIDKLLDNKTYTEKYATVAVINFHGEGLLIDRTNGYSFKSQLKSAIPNVNLIND